MPTCVKFTIMLICGQLSGSLISLGGKYFNFWDKGLTFEEVLIISGFYALLYAVEDMFEKHKGSK